MHGRHEQHHRFEDFILTLLAAAAVFVLVLALFVLFAQRPKKAVLSIEAGITPQAEQGTARFTASRNGIRYYPKDCASATRIKEANRIYFQREADAIAAGYTRAKVC